MKLVNPIGKTPLTGNFNLIVPRACICNSGSQDILVKFGGGTNCACQCKDNNTANENANYSMAYGYSN